jgi:aspartyl-tRNA(Asn)/glutamyl-tRNA(Gln) amidotransferase subunit C
MSNVNEEQIIKVCNLAKIAVTESEVENFTLQVNKVLSWVEQLNNLDTSNVEPLSNTNNTILTLHPDKINQENTSQDVFSNTNHGLYNYFTVPKVIE